MNITWDERKRLHNIHKHGLDFVDAARIFDGYTLTWEDDRVAYGETRYLTLGMLDSRCVSIVHTETSETIRIISLRKATRYEQKIYFRAIFH